MLRPMLIDNGEFSTQLSTKAVQENHTQRAALSGIKAYRKTYSIVSNG